LSKVVQVHFSEGRIYMLESGGELYCDNELFMSLPEDTLDFCVYHSDIYALRPDGLYLSGKRIWNLSLNDEIRPTNVLVLPSENTEAYILLSDGSCCSKRLEQSRGEFDVETADL